MFYFGAPPAAIAVTDVLPARPACSLPMAASNALKDCAPMSSWPGTFVVDVGATMKVGVAMIPSEAAAVASVCTSVL